jgi:hypothetical protein
VRSTRELLREATDEQAFFKEGIRQIRKLAEVLWLASCGDYWCLLKGNRELDRSLESLFNISFSTLDTWDKPNSFKIKLSAYPLQSIEGHTRRDTAELLETAMELFIKNELTSLSRNILGMDPVYHNITVDPGSLGIDWYEPTFLISFEPTPPSAKRRPTARRR